VRSLCVRAAGLIGANRIRIRVPFVRGRVSLTGLIELLGTFYANSSLGVYIIIRGARKYLVMSSYLPTKNNVQQSFLNAPNVSLKAWSIATNIKCIIVLTICQGSSRTPSKRMNNSNLCMSLRSVEVQEQTQARAYPRNCFILPSLTNMPSTILRD
jgi:hypothetical protein